MAKVHAILAVSICIGVITGCGGTSGDICGGLLVGCGGENNNAGQNNSPDGYFVGTTSTGRTTAGLLLDNGTYYLIYSAQNNPAIIAGAGTGNGTALNGSFTSTNGLDINLEGLGILAASVSASYVQKKSFNGTVAYPSLNQTITFTGTYDVLYESAPSLSAIAGTYAGSVGIPSKTESATLTISTAGLLTGLGSGGCRLTGTVSPRAKGNVYNVSAAFGGAPCLLPNTALTGVAYYDAPSRRLYAVGLTAARDNGAIYAGTKQ
jgi:hypothetical protein